MHEFSICVDRYERGGGQNVLCCCGVGCGGGSHGDYVTKSRFPLIRGMQRKEGYVVGEAAGDGVADVVEAALSHRSQSPPSFRLIQLSSPQLVEIV